jgi:hypothetical protein
LKVKVVGLVSARDGLVYRLKMPLSKSIQWDKTRRLMNGSLLALTLDNFETVVWAVVYNRGEDVIKESMIDVQLVNDGAVGSFNLSLAPQVEFTVLENVSIYFEAYRHVLIALQRMTPSEVPFPKTLMTLAMDEPPPRYLSVGNDTYSLGSVFSNAPNSFSVLEQWPDMSALNLDPSQLAALKHSLTNEVALIQGPPGTGKTFVGLKVTQAILENTRVAGRRRTPILVMCYTNHALDQFLEGIMGSASGSSAWGRGRSLRRCRSACSRRYSMISNRRGSTFRHAGPSSTDAMRFVRT